MKKNEIITDGIETFRVLAVNSKLITLINIRGTSLPLYVCYDSIKDYTVIDEPISNRNWDSLSPIEQKTCHDRFNLISDIVPFVDNPMVCSQLIKRVAEENDCSVSKIKKYLITYLVHQDIASLAPKKKEEKELTQDEKNMRWALNKTILSPKRFNLTDAFTFLLKEKYTDETGRIVEVHPSYWQFRYFYRNYRKKQNYYISRDGLSSYKRNNRPLLGGGVQAFAPTIGSYMLDSTICDIYLINDKGELVGRPILTVAVDAHSSLCTGYLLSWEGGSYSLRGLFLNVISDKVELCRKLGIEINRDDWNSSKLPRRIITDRGREYISHYLEPLSEIGVSIINVEAFRADLKGPVEQFFNLVQNSYKPFLKGKGIIQPDFQERGAEDYRKQASLTFEQFERIVVRCILFYNNKRIINNYPYSKEMLDTGVLPYASSIWNYLLEKSADDFLIETDKGTLVLTMLPRTEGKFARNGLVVNKIRYRNTVGNYTEKFLSGGKCVVAYNPDNVNVVWIVEEGRFIPFELVEQRFVNQTVEQVESTKKEIKKAISVERESILQARVDLANQIETIANRPAAKRRNKTKTIRQNRKNERVEKHRDFVEEVTDGK